MKLTTNTYRIAILSAVLAMAGCSSTLVVPTEDRNNTSPRVEQTKPVVNDSAIAIALPEETVNQSQQSTAPLTTEPNAISVPISPSVIEPAQQNTAVIALLNEANSYSKQGDLRSAQTSLQRAQRIAPRDPQVYYALANTHLTLQDYGLAEQVALKGVSIVQGQPDQLNQFWNLIAFIRDAAGNTSGAKQARETASRY
ncbi:MAG: tetratricopeptide repeat protein [Pseudomonadota bacterium]|nr:tetratricopeptide repeat protein [Pseudomonadota bacterium]MDO7711355.1 tetratricopeptide repeat protein [Pseudomonadota bacterium]